MAEKLDDAIYAAAEIESCDVGLAAYGLSKKNISNKQTSEIRDFFQFTAAAVH